MPQIIPQGDIFEKIGGQIGQGIGDQVERGTLGRALEKIPGMPPELAKLARAPGGERFLPYALPFAQAKRDQEVYNELSAQKPLPTTQSSSPPAQGGIGQAAPQQSITATGIDRTSPHYLTDLPEEEIGRRAAEISTSKGIPFDRAKAIVEKTDKSRVSREKQFEDKRNLALKEFNGTVETIRQKHGDGIFKDVSGRGLQDFNEALDARIASGENPVLAAQKLGKDLDRYADSKINLIAEGNKSYFGRKGSRTKEIIKAAQNEFAKVGRQEDMKNILINNHNLSEDLAASFAYPIKESKDVFSKLESLPSIKGEGKLGFRDKAHEGAIKFANDIIKNIESTDSIQSIANYLGQKGYDKTAFVDEIRRMSALKKFEPNARQSREILKSPPSIAPLGDLYFKFFGGEE